MDAAARTTAAKLIRELTDAAGPGGINKKQVWKTLAEKGLDPGQAGEGWQGRGPIVKMAGVVKRGDHYVSSTTVAERVAQKDNKPKITQRPVTTHRGQATDVCIQFDEETVTLKGEKGMKLELPRVIRAVLTHLVD